MEDSKRNVVKETHGNPSVSIIIPVYNRPLLLSDAVESVLAQTCSDWELILVDDGSQNQTLQVIQKYVLLDKRIHFISRNRDPKGATTCRNLGAAVAKGEFLIFLDSDDLLAPWCVEKRLKLLKDNPILDLGLFHSLVYSEKSNNFFLRTDSSEGDFLMRFLNFKNAWLTISVIWRKKFFDKLQGWDETAISWQDPILHIEALINGCTFLWDNQNIDSLIRELDGVETISNRNNYFDKLINQVEKSAEILSKIKDQHKIEFKESIKARIWKSSFYFSLPKIFKIAQVAHSSKIFESPEKIFFKRVSFLNFFLKGIPLIRKITYKKITFKSLKGNNFLELPLNCSQKMFLRKKLKENRQPENIFFRVLKYYGINGFLK